MRPQDSGAGDDSLLIVTGGFGAEDATIIDEQGPYDDDDDRGTIRLPPDATGRLAPPDFSANLAGVGGGDEDSTIELGSLRLGRNLASPLGTRRLARRPAEPARSPESARSPELSRSSERLRAVNAAPPSLNSSLLTNSAAQPVLNAPASLSAGPSATNAQHSAAGFASAENLAVQCRLQLRLVSSPSASEVWEERLREAQLDPQALVLENRAQTTFGTNGDIKFNGNGIAPIHARVIFHEGLFEVEPAKGLRVMLNGRVITTRAPIYRGDTVTLGDIQGPSFLIESMSPEPLRPEDFHIRLRVQRLRLSHGEDPYTAVVYKAQSEDRYGGVTFSRQRIIAIGRERDCDIGLGHDLVGDTHAEIVFEDGAYIILPFAGNAVLLNNRPIQGSTSLCRGDEITLVGPGGPSLIVEMLKPDRAPGRRVTLPRLLSPFGFVVYPIADRLLLPPLAVFLLGSVAGLCFVLALLVFIAARSV